MSEEVSKNWLNSSNRWTYLKIAFIRGRLIDAGVLGISNSEESSKIDLDKGHI